MRDMQELPAALHPDVTHPLGAFTVILAVVQQIDRYKVVSIHYRLLFLLSVCPSN